MSRTCLTVVLLLAMAAIAPLAVPRPEPVTTAPASRPAITAPVRGMTISCQTWGWEWGTDEMVASMERLRALGVNWITIHPYAGIRADGTVSMRRRGGDDATWITRPIAEAHRLDMKILIKPHLAYWGSPFSWRGEIAFETDEQWQRFFETYEQWIVEMAGTARDADAFAVGTELGGTVHHEAPWRRIIVAVRAATDAPLIYSANWDRFEAVPFWDAVDLIGIQSYFPLVAHENPPTRAELRDGWTRLLARLNAHAKQHDRPILLAELGYNRSALAAARPWDYRQGGADAEDIQQRCLDAALRALEREDRVLGAMLWKWFPGEDQRGNFIKSTPAMQDVIRTHWAR